MTSNSDELYQKFLALHEAYTDVVLPNKTSVDEADIARARADFAAALGRVYADHQPRSLLADENEKVAFKHSIALYLTLFRHLQQLTADVTALHNIEARYYRIRHAVTNKIFDSARALSDGEDRLLRDIAHVARHGPNAAAQRGAVARAIDALRRYWIALRPFLVRNFGEAEMRHLFKSLDKLEYDLGLLDARPSPPPSRGSSWASSEQSYRNESSSSRAPPPHRTEPL